MLSNRTIHFSECGHLADLDCASVFNGPYIYMTGGDYESQVRSQPMIEELPDVPPALSLLFAEVALSTSWQESRRRIKDLLPTLRDQSGIFLVENSKRLNYSRDPFRFEIHLHGSLDLLMGDGCVNLECRVNAADHVARSVGLIADRVWLTDTFSERFLDFGRATNAKLDQVMSDVVVLARLLPLIKAGIIRFRSPWIPTCAACAAEFDGQVERTASEMTHVFRRDFSVKRRPDGGFVGHTGKCFEPPLVMHSYKTDMEAIPSARSFAASSIIREIRSTLWVAREASLTGGSILSNSRLGLSGLLQQEGRLPDRRSLLLLDREREISVPWVSELDAAQIVQLREEASKALPAFRNCIAKALSISDSEVSPSRSTNSIVAELREQAQEVRSELKLRRASSSRYWKTTYGLLGLGLSAYGVASDQLLPGIGGLLPVIQLLIAHKAGHEADLERLSTRPGYVLVKAQDLLAHAH